MCKFDVKEETTDLGSVTIGSATLELLLGSIPRSQRLLDNAIAELSDTDAAKRLKNIQKVAPGGRCASQSSRAHCCSVPSRFPAVCFTWWPAAHRPVRGVENPAV